jgi:hypothetical protein
VPPEYEMMFLKIQFLKLYDVYYEFANDLAYTIPPSDDEIAEYVDS